MEKYRSTVFRVNMPPGSPFFPDPRVIVLLDQRSFSVLFDVNKVRKQDVLTGTYKPSSEFNGGYPAGIVKTTPAGEAGIVAYFSRHAGPLLEMAESRHGVPRDEALHNLIFVISFNAFTGMTRLVPALVEFLKGDDFETELRGEVRSAVSEVGALDFKAMEKMPLLKSYVYEVLRLNPPVAYQYGRAREDMVIETHREAFQVRKGEMLCGFQPFVTRDPVVFERPNEFVPKRFVGEQGSKLLKYVLWSNGPETESPSVDNKQCAGKDFIILVTRFFLAEFLLRYDSFHLDKPVQKGPEKIYAFEIPVKTGEH